METAVSVNMVKESKNKKFTFLNQGIREIRDNRARIKFMVEIDGKQIDYWPNKTSLSNIAQKWGNNSNSWVGKVCNLTIGHVNGKESIIAMPE